MRFLSVKKLGASLVLVAALPLTVAADPPPLLTRAPAHPEHNRATGAISQQTLFLDRCVGGCTITPGDDNAAGSISELAATTTMVTEYPWADGEWEGVLKCVQDVYSPYNIIVTDQRPQGVFNRTIVGGSAIGYGQMDSCGLAIVDPNCAPRTNAIALAFTDSGNQVGGCINGYQQEDDNNAIWGMCWIVAQESAHTYGLDHEYMFQDGTSACRDPMTYRSDCGGEKFFRNEFANCSGNDGVPKSGCGPDNTCATNQNSHQKLLSALGPGTPTTTPPVVAIASPMSGPVANGAAIFATASSERGVAKIDLLLNGYDWGSVPGAAFGDAGQPASEYTFTLPSNVPDGVIDIQAVAYDDLGINTTSSTVTVQKGAPCTSASTCLTGQMCSAGKCFWNAPAGALGDSCTYPQFCTSGECEGTSSSDQFCTTDCVPGITGTCLDGYNCVQASSPTAGFCLPADSGGGGGCCSVGGAGDSGFGAIATHGGLAALVLAMLIRRRRHA